MPGGIGGDQEDREDHGFMANTGQSVEPVSESYSGGGQTRDLFSIVRKLGFLGCLVPFLCSLCGISGGIVMLGYDWVVYTLKNGWNSEYAGWGIGFGVAVLVIVATTVILLGAWLKKKLARRRR